MKSDFRIEHELNEAIELSPEQSIRVANALLDPPEPNAELQALLARGQRDDLYRALQHLIRVYDECDDGYNRDLDAAVEDARLVLARTMGQQIRETT